MTQVTLNNGSVDSAGSLLLKTNGTTTAVTIDTAQKVFLNSSAVPTGVTGTGVSLWNKQSNTSLNAINTVASASDAFTYLGTNASVGAIGVSYGSTAGYLPLAFYTSDAEKMRLDTSGNLGVGTTSPSYRLHASSATGATIVGQTNTSGTITYNMTGANLYIDSSVSSFYAFRNQAGTESMRIDSSGNLLVGATSGSNKLTVATATQPAAILCQNSHNVSGDFSLITQLGSNCNNTSSYHLISATGGVDKFYIYGNGTYGTVSDESLKKNIELARDGYLNDVMRLRVVKYNWKTDDDFVAKELGWIAQEVENVFPGLVQDGPKNENGESNKQVKTSVLPFILLKAIQEQQALITTLTERITALEQA